MEDCPHHIYLRVPLSTSSNDSDLWVRISDWFRDRGYHIERDREVEGFYMDIGRVYVELKIPYVLFRFRSASDAILFKLEFQ